MRVFVTSSRYGQYEDKVGQSLIVKKQTDFHYVCGDKYIHKDDCEEIPDTEDTVVRSVINKYKIRSQKGINKYNKTLDRDDLSVTDWITHAQEEAMDFTLYLEKLKLKLVELGIK